MEGKKTKNTEDRKMHSACSAKIKKNQTRLYTGLSLNSTCITYFVNNTYEYNFKRFSPLA